MQTGATIESPYRSLSSHSELIGYFFSQHIHVPAYFVVGDLGVYLGCGDMFMAEHLADRLQRYALRQCHRGRERVPRLVDRGTERQSGMTCNMAKRHIHRITVFDWEHFIAGVFQEAVTLNEFFGYGQQFNPKLRTRFLSVVDNPHIASFVRMNVVIGKFLYICIGQSRETAEYENIPYNGSLVVGNLHINHSLQFRFGQKTAVASYPAVPESRIGHQLQLLNRSMDTAGEHITDGRKVHYVLLDKLTFQLFERYIFQLIFVLQECGQIAARTGVIFERPLRTIFAYALFSELGQVSVERLQQELIAVPETQPCVPDLLGGDIRIPVTDALADIGLDILQLLVDALGDDALTGCFIGFGVPQFG